MLVYFISLDLLSEFTKLFCISSMCGTGSFSTKWLYCKVSGRSVSSQVETVVTCVFLFSRHKANFLTRPCDCLFYIVFYQWNHSSLLFWKAWVRLLSHAGKGKKKVQFCLFNKTKQCTLLLQRDDQLSYWFYIVHWLLFNFNTSIHPSLIRPCSLFFFDLHHLTPASVSLSFIGTFRWVKPGCSGAAL